MRVISGTARGHRLKAPRGMRTRPMADKIREAAFSMLASLGVQPVRVLDLYAGSGSVGIEALSRGAEWVDFVEHNAAACAVIRDNLASTRFTERAAVHQTTVEGFIGWVREPYDFIIMDPPYASPTIPDVIAALARSPAVERGTILLIGHSPRVALPERIGGLELLRQRCHGDSCFSIYEAVALASGPAEG
jgi:16S rRNA (guanine966-N2)-methyltransferase